MIRDGIKSVAKQGVCPETEWAYDISKFADQPPQQCYTDAIKYEALSYQKIRPYSLAQIQSCLAAGYPIIFGFLVYESFESDQVASTGIVPMPRHGEQELGGHCVVAVGYNTSKRVVYGRNSWSDKWGQDGYFEMPFSYFTHSGLTSDLWTIRTVM
jgi:C1A family cysteine protease